jgi:hypothetical protein
VQSAVRDDKQSIVAVRVRECCDLLMMTLDLGEVKALVLTVMKFSEVSEVTVLFLKEQRLF